MKIYIQNFENKVATVKIGKENTLNMHKKLRLN